MQDSEVHSLILDRLERIDDPKLRSFLDDILRHEREILDEPRGQYKDEYKALVDEAIDADLSGE